MLVLASIASQQAMRRSVAGARADDPVVPGRAPRRPRRLIVRSPQTTPRPRGTIAASRASS